MCTPDFSNKSPEQIQAEYLRNPNGLLVKESYRAAGQPRVYSSDINAPLPPDPLPAMSPQESQQLDTSRSVNAMMGDRYNRAPGGMQQDSPIGAMFRAVSPRASARTVR